MPRVKLQRTGDGTYYVYLPKSSIETKNLKKGDLVDISETDSSILLSPISLSWSRRRDLKQTFEVSESSADLEWKILSGYLSGCLYALFCRKDGKEFSAEQITTANDIIQRLRGIESSINQKELEFIDVVNYETINAYDEIKRMFKVIKALLQQERTLLKSFRLFNVVADSLHRHWTFEKEQINPISFYIHRILSVELQFPDVLIKSMENPVDCQHVAMVTYILERIGDVIFGMAQNMSRIYVPSNVVDDLLAYPSVYIENQIKTRHAFLKNIIDNMEEPMDFFAIKTAELHKMLDGSEEIVCTKNANKGLLMRDSTKRWRTKFDEEIVKVVSRIGDPFLLQSILSIAFRFRELSTYIESLSSRTCQLYYAGRIECHS